MSITVEKLIEELSKIEDKEKTIKLSVSDEVVGDFYVRESAIQVFLSNYGEASYKARNIN